MKGARRIAIAVRPLKHSAIAVGNTLNDAGGALKVETARGPYRDPPDMHPGLLAGGHARDHPVAGLKAFDAFVAGEIAPWKTVAIDSGPLITAAARGFDLQRGLLPTAKRINLAHTGGVPGVGFRNR